VGVGDGGLRFIAVGLRFVTDRCAGGNGRDSRDLCVREELIDGNRSDDAASASITA
jgi:hypothetical protein